MIGHVAILDFYQGCNIFSGYRDMIKFLSPEMSEIGYCISSMHIRQIMVPIGSRRVKICFEVKFFY